MFTQFLFRKIDNAQLVVFRIFYGLLVAAECYGAIATGWVRRTMVEPKFTFSFIGFEWLQPLPGNGMYIYFAVMGTLGLWLPSDTNIDSALWALPSCGPVCTSCRKHPTITITTYWCYWPTSWPFFPPIGMPLWMPNSTLGCVPKPCTTGFDGPSYCNCSLYTPMPQWLNYMGIGWISVSWNCWWNPKSIIIWSGIYSKKNGCIK